MYTSTQAVNRTPKNTRRTEHLKLEPRFLSHVALVLRRSRIVRVSEQVETFNHGLKGARRCEGYEIKLLSGMKWLFLA